MNRSVVTLLSLIVLGIGFGLGWAVKPGTESSEESGKGQALSIESGGAVAAGASSGSSSPRKMSVGSGESTSNGPALLGKFLTGSGALTGTAAAAAASAVMSESNPLLRHKMFAELLDKLTPENAKEILAVVNGTAGNDPGKGYLSALLNHAWGKVDGKSAVEYAQTLGQRQSGMAVATAISGWAVSNPEEAKSWVAEQEDGMGKMFYTGGLIAGLATSDPNGATDFVLEMDESNPARGRFLEIVTNEQLKGGFENAGQWAANLSDDKLKGDAFERIARDYTRSDPEQAAKWIEAHAGSEYATEAVEEVADEWAEKDPSAAIAWAQTLDEGSRGGAMESAFSEWTQNDPKGASEYLTAMDESDPNRDYAISGFTDRLAREDPKSAVTWASSIQNEEMREEAMIDAGRSWYRQDQEAAGVWLETSGLSTDAAAQVVKPRDRGGDWGQALRGAFGG